MPAPINVATLSFLLMLVVSTVDVGAQPSQSRLPHDLKECYTRIALEKSTADTMYLARSICDQLFKPRPRSIVVLDAKTRKCQEQWFDSNGRHESSEMYCAFEPDGVQRWTYACESKNKKLNRYTLVDLQEDGDRYTRRNPVIGKDPGPLFKTMAACIRHKAGGSR